MILFYDTETTGIPLFKEPSWHPDQPHIVQLAAALVDTKTRNTVASIDVIIKPDGYVISPEMTAIHGISNEFANDVGVELKHALPMFLSLASGKTRVAFNQQFDARLVRIAQHKLDHLFTDDDLENWKTGYAECAMRMAHKYTNLPKNKLPKLSEAHQHFFGVDFENAHNAMADVNACIAVYFAVKDLEVAK
jgi:DNA polymerase-3 subunit epsilon